MKQSTKKRLKFFLAVFVLLVGFYIFSMVGAGVYAIGFAMLCVAISDFVVWPEAWREEGQVKGRQHVYVFVAGLIVSVALFCFGWLQSSI